MGDLRFERRMSGSDMLALRIERDPVLRLVISGVAVLESPVDRQRFRDRLDRTSLLLPRLRQRVVRAPLSLAPPRFLVAPDFDLDEHVFFEAAPGEGSLRDVLGLTERLAAVPFPPGRPLWRLTSVEGMAGGGGAVLFKVHHALTDGVGAIQLLMLLLDLERDPVLPPLPPAPTGEATSGGERLGDLLTYSAGALATVAGRLLTAPVRLARDPIGGARRLSSKAMASARLLNPRFRPRSPIMRGRSTQWRFEALTVPLAELKGAAKLVDGRLNDAFVAAVAGGMRRYHEHHGEAVDGLRMTMPIDTREGDDASRAGNDFAPARFVVPIAIEDPVERMRSIRRLVLGARGDAAAGVVEGIAGVLNKLPAALGPELYGRMLRGVDFLTSNVPGVPVPVFLAGREVESFFAYGPISGSALNVTLLSYRESCHLGASIDLAAVPDPEVLMDCLEQGLAEVRALA